MKIAGLQFRPIVDPPKIGIYVLLSRGEVVYVGRSVDIEARVRQHRRRAHRGALVAAVAFDDAAWIPVARGELGLYERVLIHALKPAANLQRYDIGRKHHELARRLGISISRW